VRSWASARGRGRGFGGRADSHHSLRQDRTLADKGEEMVDGSSLSRSGSPYRRRRHAGRLGLPAAAEPDRRGLDPRVQSGRPVEPGAVRLIFRQPVSGILEHGPCDPGSPRAALVFGGRTDSHHSLRHDRCRADKCEEIVYGDPRNSAQTREPGARRASGRTGPSRVERWRDRASAQKYRSRRHAVGTTPGCR
jgi:hypothetical protein